jgi:hypothetical protein
MSFEFESMFGNDHSHGLPLRLFVFKELLLLSFGSKEKGPLSTALSVTPAHLLRSLSFGWGKFQDDFRATCRFGEARKAYRFRVSFLDGSPSFSLRIAKSESNSQLSSVRKVSLASRLPRSSFKLYFHPHVTPLR